MYNNGWKIGLGVLGVGLILWLVLRNKQSPPAAGPVSDGIVRLGRGNYDNEEIRDIEYNADGLPTRITIHRHASVV